MIPQSLGDYAFIGPLPRPQAVPNTIERPAIDIAEMRVHAPVRLHVVLTGIRFFALACLFARVAAAADATGVLTLLDGGAGLLRGTARYSTGEGLRLQPGDILETADKAFVQIEFAGGAVVALGARSRILVLRSPASSLGAAQLFLLEGWLKLSAREGGQAARLECLTPLFSLGPAKAIAVARVSERDGEVFAEAGTVPIADLSAEGRVESTRQLREGELYSRSPSRRSAVAPRPSQSFVAAMPREFRDNLMPRLAALKRSDTPPKRAAEFRYEEVEAWLNTTPAVRTVLVEAWREKLGDPAFREAVKANLKRYPEWERVLHPAHAGEGRTKP